jgi:hypothetical protein
MKSDVHGSSPTHYEPPANDTVHRICKAAAKESTRSSRLMANCFQPPTSSCQVWVPPAVWRRSLIASHCWKHYSSIAFEPGSSALISVICRPWDRCGLLVLW